jgi:HlyD family secretion protein
MPDSLPTAGQLEEVLEKAPRRARRRRWILGLGVATTLVLGLGLTIWSLTRGGETVWRTEPATVEDLSVRITAVGTIAPRLVVDVGSEQSGVVSDVFVDANDPVKKGQPLAELDQRVLSLQDREAHAQMASLVASLEQAKTAVAASELDWSRTQALDRAGALAPADRDRVSQALENARGARAAAEAQLSAARARLDMTNTNLKKAVIRSPIDGVVLVRNIDPGQSVVASFQAVTLFQVAQGLEDLEVDVDIDEADVPRVAPGQPATFTVPAWPDREFTAEVSKLHLAPQTSSGVVTYRAELLAKNIDGALRVGMTATARIEAARTPGALTVPLAALRWAPALLPEGLAPTAAGQGRVWVLEGAEPKPVVVTLGPSDGLRQAVTGPLKDKDLLVVGQDEAK